MEASPMASIYKPTHHGKPSKFWYIAYRDHTGKRKKKKGFRDKKATEALAVKIETDVERKKAGLTVVDETNLLKSFEEAHQEYLDELNRLGASKSHRDSCRKMIK